jgi:hypothetical protein
MVTGYFETKMASTDTFRPRPNGLAVRTARRQAVNDRSVKVGLCIGLCMTLWILLVKAGIEYIYREHPLTLCGPEIAVMAIQLEEGRLDAVRAFHAIDRVRDCVPQEHYAELRKRIFGDVGYDQVEALRTHGETHATYTLLCQVFSDRRLDILKVVRPRTYNVTLPPKLGELACLPSRELLASF